MIEPMAICSASSPPPPARATTGMSDSGSAVPTAASSAPTAPAPRLSRWPSHSTALVKPSAPTTISTNDSASSRTVTGCPTRRADGRAAAVASAGAARRGSGPATLHADIFGTVPRAWVLAADTPFDLRRYACPPAIRERPPRPLLRDYREGLASNGGEQSTKDQAQEKAQQAAGQAKEQAQQVAGQAKGRARTVVDERSTQAGQQVNQQAGDLRTRRPEAPRGGQGGPAKFADQAADRGERLGRYLEQSDADRILSDIEDFGRRQPWAVALGGLALGFAASRFLKASSSQRYQSRSGYGRLRNALRLPGAQPPGAPAHEPAAGALDGHRRHRRPGRPAGPDARSPRARRSPRCRPPRAGRGC